MLDPCLRLQCFLHSLNLHGKSKCDILVADIAVGESEETVSEPLNSVCLLSKTPLGEEEILAIPMILDNRRAPAGSSIA